MALQKICIFGTGSAGWLTALHLRTLLPEVQLILLNSKKVGNIGVGESTQPELIRMIREANIDLDLFIREVDATQKHGIFYRNWNNIGDHYWHPFTSLSAQGFITDAHQYQFMSTVDPVNFSKKDYYKKVHESYEICVEKNQTSDKLNYALHIDADKLALFLRRTVTENVTVIDFDVCNVNHNSKSVQSIEVDGVPIEADLFVDCSGFNRYVIGKISDCEDDGYEGNVNAALFGRIPYDDYVKSIPYTRADAWRNGWVWTIPLQSRVGSGCVYNKNFCSEEEAKEFFVDYWKGSLKKENIRSIPYFSSKSLIEPWKGNVVAIGLSSGFIEPLEATGLAWTNNASGILGVCLRNRYFDQHTRNKYNSLVRSYIEDIQDFIDVHYMLSSRRDSEFWKYQTNRPRSQRLMARLDNYRKYMPNKSNRNTSVTWCFNDISWIDILNGYEFEYELENVEHNDN